MFPDKLSLAEQTLILNCKTIIAMKSFYVLLIIFWLIIPEYTFSQTDTITLTPNVKCEGFINKSEIHLLKVNLQTGEFVRGFVDRGSSTTRIMVLFPD